MMFLIIVVIQLINRLMSHICRSRDILKQFGRFAGNH